MLFLSSTLNIIAISKAHPTLLSLMIKRLASHPRMIADGLTKALPGQKFATFVKQLGLIDISTLLGI
ncbi:hypothetical protein HRG_013638 [Hirsutella rhossiliensis]